MNIIYETTKERGATILMPTAMVDAMNPGGLLGLTQAAMSAQAKPGAPAADASVVNQPARRSVARAAATEAKRKR
jgi:hypothetical protein